LIRDGHKGAQMIRLASYAIALSVIITVTATLVECPSPAGASPMPAAAARSIDVSNPWNDCRVSSPAPDDKGSATLSASARASNLTVAAVTKQTTILDALPPATLPMVASWQHVCASGETLAA
jgi:hypothetical protein